MFETGGLYTVRTKVSVNNEHDALKNGRLSTIWNNRKRIYPHSCQCYTMGCGCHESRAILTNTISSNLVPVRVTLGIKQGAEVPNRPPYNPLYTPRNQLGNVKCPKQKRKKHSLDHNPAHCQTKYSQAKPPVTLCLEKRISIVQGHDSPNCIYLWPRERSDQDHDPSPIHKGGNVKNLHISSFRQVGNLRHGYGDCNTTVVIVSMMLHFANWPPTNPDELKCLVSPVWQGLEKPDQRFL
jgi:hypothetical protein